MTLNEALLSHSRLKTSLVRFELKKARQVIYLFEVLNEMEVVIISRHQKNRQ